MVRLETHVVRRCKALQAAAWQLHARFEATQQVRSNCVIQGDFNFVVGMDTLSARPTPIVQLDIRLPMGVLFIIFGLMLAG